MVVEMAYRQGCLMVSHSSLDSWPKRSLNIPFSSFFTRPIGEAVSVQFWDEEWLGTFKLADVYPRLYALESMKDCNIFDRLLKLSGHLSSAWNWRRSIRNVCYGKSSHLREYSRPDGARALLVPERYKTDALVSSWGCPKTKLRRKDEKRDIPLVSDEILGTQSREFGRTSSLRVVPVRLPEHSPERLPEISPAMFRWPFGYLRHHVPPVSCDQLLGLSYGLFFLHVRFVLLSFILFTFPFSLHHMSSGSQTVGDVVVPKFDMHVYTFVLTSDEVKNLVAEYAIPLDLHPCFPPSGLTMNRLSADKIDAMPWRHQDSSVADPAPISVRAEDIR
ncbi:hypothetical protein Tco_0669081 [Tanacetum coccineum]